MPASTLVSRLHQLGRQLTDFVLPPTCGVCRSVVDQPGALCMHCWRQINFISSPHCACCGIPFSLPAEPGSLCALCLQDPPGYVQARSVMVYDESSSRLISRFKYGDQLHLIETLVPWLTRAGAELLSASDVLIPVPLHRWRLWHRRYNQSALLARALGVRIHKPVELQALRRLRSTRPQVGMTREERQQNVADAFFADPRRLAGRRVLLIDDVLTTGATLQACTGALLAAGASEVRVLTLARVVRPGQVV